LGLKSTGQRYVERLFSMLNEPPSETDKTSLLRGELKTLYRRFKSEAWPLLGARERSLWDIMFTMKHYRLPTCLLDWTESFGCALFFAQWHRSAEDTAVVWVLDAELLNEKSVGKRGIINLDDDDRPSVVNVRQYHPHWVQPVGLKTIAVSPIVINARMKAQRSVFTLAGDSFAPLDQQFDGDLTRERILAKFDFPPQTFREVEEYLRLAGLRPFTYFPDLDGLAFDHEARLAETLRELPRFYPEECGPNF
jgi:hypothetical protein